jgi:hypothetical protein
LLKVRHYRTSNVVSEVTELGYGAVELVVSLPHVGRSDNISVLVFDLCFESNDFLALAEGSPPSIISHGFAFGTACLIAQQSSERFKRFTVLLVLFARQTLSQVLNEPLNRPLVPTCSRWSSNERTNTDA